jgi:hypothetical protein
MFGQREAVSCIQPSYTPGGGGVCVCDVESEFWTTAGFCMLAAEEFTLAALCSRNKKATQTNDSWYLF